jgi:hypothetical protein
MSNKIALQEIFGMAENNHQTTLNETLIARSPAASAQAVPSCGAAVMPVTMRILPNKVRRCWSAGASDHRYE